MNASFLITQITVKFIGNGNDYIPLVFKSKSNQIVNGLYCSLATNTPEDPIKIYQSQPTPNGNSFITIATSRGEYQIFWTNGDTANPYYIMLQSLTSPKPYPDNQVALWSGSVSAQNFTLNIDMTVLANGDGISLIPSV